MMGLKSRKQKLCWLVMSMAGFIFYASGVLHYCLLAEDPPVWQIVSGEDSIQTEEDYERVQEEREKEGQEREINPSYAFWKKEESQKAENQSLNRTSNVTVWKARGSLDVLFPSFAVLQEDDWQGCYLAEDTAWELFGSTEAAGGEITCGQRRLTVRGVLKGETSLVVMRPESQETTDRISLEETSAARAESFLMRYGSGGKMVNSGFLAEILQWILLLYPGTLAVGFLKSLKDDYPGGEAGKIFWWLFWWLILVGTGYFLFRNIKIPETMIPGRWSDFQFWKNWWKSFQEQIVHFAEMDHTGRELRQTENFLKGAVCSVIPFLTTAMKEEIC